MDSIGLDNFSRFCTGFYSHYHHAILPNLYLLKPMQFMIVFNWRAPVYLTISSIKFLLLFTSDLFLLHFMSLSRQQLLVNISTILILCFSMPFFFDFIHILQPLYYFPFLIQLHFFNLPIFFIVHFHLLLVPSSQLHFGFPLFLDVGHVDIDIRRYISNITISTILTILTIFNNIQYSLS